MRLAKLLCYLFLSAILYAQDSTLVEQASLDNRTTRAQFQGGNYGLKQYIAKKYGVSGRSSRKYFDFRLDEFMRFLFSVFIASMIKPAPLAICQSYKKALQVLEGLFAIYLFFV